MFRWSYSASLKHNVSRKNCHIIIVGYQAYGTTGRKLVDGEEHVRMWGETYKVSAKVHTVGGISAHADQEGLCRWYKGFENNPKVYLVHGEPEAINLLADKLKTDFNAQVNVAEYLERVEL